MPVASTRFCVVPETAQAPGLARTADTWHQLLELDPWLPSYSWPIWPTSSSICELPLDEVLQSHVTAITHMPSGATWWSGRRMCAVAPPSYSYGGAPEEAIGEDAGFAAGELSRGASLSTPATAPQMLVRSNFVTTPLVLSSLMVEAGGAVHIPWTVPDNAGSFEIRAYAAARDAPASFGASTAEQLVRKLATLSPSVPRIVRVGDTFRCGATVTGSPELPVSSAIGVSVVLSRVGLVNSTEGSVQASGLPLAATSSLEQTLVLQPSQTIEVTFPFTALSMGEVVLTMTLSPADGGTSSALGDALEVVLPVLGVQPSVVVATSMALEATEAGTLWEEGVVLPRAIPGTGALNLDVGTGRLPSLLVLSSGLL